ncbi:MAG: aminofutalosine synthase MqnE [Myxococcota bacterium]
MNLNPALRAATRAAGIEDLADKVEAGERLTFDDARRLYDVPDLAAVGGLADVVRERLHGDVSWFNRNLHINATNVCEATCIFCSFSRLETGQPGAYTMSFAEAVGRVAALRDAFITEVHIVNGLNPDLPFDYYPDLLRALKAERPDLHIKGFTAVEIHYYAEKYDMSVAQVLEHLHAAGLDSMPGGGAEIFADRARKKLCHDKVDSDSWLDIHRTAHRMGFRTNATMLFGSIETIDERIDHMDRLRSLQDETGGFQTFIPLKFHNENNRLRNVAETTGLDCLRTLAIARLYLDNFAHIKAYWPMMGVQVAQLAQAFGVSDIDGTVREERIYHMAGAKTPQGLTRSELVALIERAGRIPLERDTLYRVVAETPAIVAGTEPAPPTRIASVGYLNAWPLTHHLDRTRHEVVEDVPAAIADRLVAGDVDVALVPVATLLTEGDWRIVPGMAIGADGPVDSVLLVAESDPATWTEVVLDGESRTSAVLAQLLLAGPLKDQVGELTIRTVGRGESVPLATGTTAALVIGDAARELPERLACRLDLAALWKQWTGLPFVFAVWAGRPGLDPRVGHDLREAARRGRADVPAHFDGEDRTYLTERLRYDLDDRALMGLRRFAALGCRAGFFQNGDIELLGPQTLFAPRPAVSSDLDLAKLPLTGLLAAASERQRSRPRDAVRWAMRATVGSVVEPLAPEVSRVLVRAPDAASLQAGVDAWTAEGLEVAVPLDLAERFGMDGLTVDLDDGGALLTEPNRRAAAGRAARVLGAAHFGRGESWEARLAHLRALEELGAERVVLRYAGWRGSDTDGQGTAADWLRIAAWARRVTGLELVVPHVEGLAVVAVAAQACVDGLEDLPYGDDWQDRGHKLDRALRDAGLEPLRVGMETPAASDRRVARRRVHAPLRPDLR